jgi:hypothetical protein
MKIEFDCRGVPAIQFADTIVNDNCVIVPIVEGLFPYNVLRGISSVHVRFVIIS